ncbi:aspartate--tRNA ligase [Brachyspira aalborgi]|jgi:aspartyl-tRNA synthetase|uniref:Aspartate--tRNA(Asp/Asn) ligase n=1 Tax=Brachyspira aalborgi TaxID=29522 RepID=A0AB38PZ17_9SPIR|nr:aspartate--tRNA ligase [Brachyspira aalborgi]MBS4763920.1 aspartate--tRNA ligase [Brachyspira sp.]CCY76083.1 aspartate--tRNA ligase [Brachyspira sp. CAG:700]TXJ14835.1 aspartate--tRNA ligase [Brachyspira aalborgi]TXJ18530.1 aspartate--tRNA ligase [Brachyspira aalborgi]TXJ24484.1 aspartate--tRNA ligase [Brachyspira aalborgi]
MRFKSAYNGTLTKNDIGKEVKLAGWVLRRRDHGGVIFVDLRDRTGFAQIVFNPQVNEEAHNKAQDLRSEFVISVVGKVRARSEEMINPKIPTGEIEVMVEKLELLNTSETPPFMLEDDIDTNEEIRLKYRYLDLRRPKIFNNLYYRFLITNAFRKHLAENGFIDVETPILNKSTPEGARDFLVPSRLSAGDFYALPQSPQIFKQILMISGFDRYYQIAKCFRDEDLRADRQPEFTQVDIETSFLSTDEFLSIMEKVIADIVKEVYNIDLPLPLPRLSYKEAMENYGSDKPDTRFELKLINVEDAVRGCDFAVFKNALDNKFIIRCLNAKGGEKLSRKDIDDFTKYVGIFGAKGLAWMRVTENGLESNIVKFFSKENQNKILEITKAEKGDLLFFVADTPKITFDALGNLRLKVAEKLNLIDKDKLNFLWVVEFPLFEYDYKEKRISATHHPFTAPVPEDIAILESDTLKVRSDTYDLVLNGNEIGGGGQRIYDSSVQAKIFNLLGISEEKAKERFGFLLEALKYGAPPMCGMAFGIDRVVMLLQKQESIREVIAFPKTQKGQCLMSGCPSTVDEEQLEELHLKIDDLV